VLLVLLLDRHCCCGDRPRSGLGREPAGDGELLADLGCPVIAARCWGECISEQVDAVSIARRCCGHSKLLWLCLEGDADSSGLGRPCGMTLSRVTAS